MKVALRFANAKEDKKPVLYHIVWKSYGNPKDFCYVMDKTVSAYPNEKEVLLMDGMLYYVKSVEDVMIEGKSLTQITLKAYDWSLKIIIVFKRPDFKPREHCKTSPACRYYLIFKHI